MTQWLPPPPPPPQPPPQPQPQGRTPVQGRRIWLGVGIALLGHMLTIAIGLLLSVFEAGSEAAALTFLFVALIGQAVLAVAALVAGIILAVRGKDGGVGAGILIGWAVGLIVTPALGFGICVTLLNMDGMFG